MAGRAQIPPKPQPILLIRFRRGNGTERVRFPAYRFGDCGAREKRKKTNFSRHLLGMLAVRSNSNASRFNGLDFSSEVGPKSFHQLAHPSDEVGSLHRFELLRG